MELQIPGWCGCVACGSGGGGEVCGGCLPFCVLWCVVWSSSRVWVERWAVMNGAGQPKLLGC